MMDYNPDQIAQQMVQKRPNLDVDELRKYLGTAQGRHMARAAVDEVISRKRNGMPMGTAFEEVVKSMQRLKNGGM